MRRWITAIFPWVAVVALLLIVARFILPAMGLAGTEGENVGWLAKLMPVATILLIGSVAIIIFELRRQSRIVDVRSRRIVEEAEEWNEQYRFGEASPERSLSWQSLSEAMTEAITNLKENGVAIYGPQETAAIAFSSHEPETITVM